CSFKYLPIFKASKPPIRIWRSNGGFTLASCLNGPSPKATRRPTSWWKAGGVITCLNKVHRRNKSSVGKNLSSALPPFIFDKRGFLVIVRDRTHRAVPFPAFAPVALGLR